MILDRCQVYEVGLMACALLLIGRLAVIEGSRRSGRSNPSMDREEARENILRWSLISREENSPRCRASWSVSDVMAIKYIMSYAKIADLVSWSGSVTRQISPLLCEQVRTAMIPSSSALSKRISSTLSVLRAQPHSACISISQVTPSHCGSDQIVNSLGDGHAVTHSEGSLLVV